MSNALGIDVSYAQGREDWREEHLDGIDFAGIKAYELGVGEDPQFARNMRLTRERFDNKLPRFPYIFAHPGASMAEQADTLIQLANDNGMQDGDNFLLDMEAGPGLATPDGMAGPEIRKWAAAFAHRINEATKAAPRRCLSYCNVSGGQLFGWGWHLWLAEYGVTEPHPPAPWTTWSFWQYGVRGVDLDQFNGDKAALLDFCNMPAHRR